MKAGMHRTVNNVNNSERKRFCPTPKIKYCLLFFVVTAVICTAQG